MHTIPQLQAFGYKHFLMSNFADGKNIQFTNHILLRPTLSITVTETIVKVHDGTQNDGN